MTVIKRKQQEILIVNGKIISVEGGAVVNSYDLSNKEFLDTAKFITDTIETLTKYNINNNYGFLKEIK